MLTLNGDPTATVAKVVQWIRQREPDAIEWIVDDLETSGSDDLERGARLDTHRLLELLGSGQVIEFDASVRSRDCGRWRILVRDGLGIDLLGYGPKPTPFEIGCTYVVADRADYYWGPEY